MGQLLSHPIEDKHIDYQTFQSLSYCVGSMQGYRMTMEDAHDIKINEDESTAVFGVFDGHGGKDCAVYLAEKLPRRIFKLSQKKDIQLNHIIRSTKDAFFEADHQLSKMHNTTNCGSTAIISTLFKNRYIVVANTGDSRCILSLNGSSKTLSFDHKPVLMNERIRIENSNGYVYNNRVNEILALSRAFGDFKFKFPFLDTSKNKYINENKPRFRDGLVVLPPELYQVTVEPEILVYDLANGVPEFMILACDGIWDCYKNSELIAVIRQKLALDWKLNKITEHILNECLLMANNYTGIGFDNMTLIIIAFHDGESLDSWYETMKTKVLREKNLAD